MPGQLPTTEVVSFPPNRNGTAPSGGVSARASTSVVGGLQSRRPPRRASARHFDWSWTPALTVGRPCDGTSVELRLPSSPRPSDPISRGHADRCPTRTDAVSRASTRRWTNRLRLFGRPVQMVHTGPRVRPRRGRALAPRSGFLAGTVPSTTSAFVGRASRQADALSAILRNGGRAQKRCETAASVAFPPRLKPWASCLNHCDEAGGRERRRLRKIWYGRLKLDYSERSLHTGGE